MREIRGTYGLWIRVSAGEEGRREGPREGSLGRDQMRINRRRGRRAWLLRTKRREERSEITTGRWGDEIWLDLMARRILYLKRFFECGNACCDAVLWKGRNPSLNPLVAGFAWWDIMFHFVGLSVLSFILLTVPFAVPTFEIITGLQPPSSNIPFRTRLLGLLGRGRYNLSSRKLRM